MNALNLKLQQELVDIKNKITKFYLFIKSSEFDKVPSVEQELMYEQLAAMRFYARALEKRCEIHKTQENDTVLEEQKKFANELANTLSDFLSNLDITKL